MSSIIAARESALATGRRVYAATKLPQTAKILRLRVGKGEDASSSEDYKEIKPPVKCKQIRGDMGSEMEQGEQIVSIRNVEIRFAWGSDVRDTDRIKIEKEVFAVISTDPTRAGALYLSATCVKVPNE